ncbi:ArsA family ATPase, partial [bacterium]|nr:ArsA family ATPase [bacterium]
KKDLKFIIFGGKGGVGKTSLACAAALRKAQKEPNKKILIFSTDPAHSLSDSFETSIKDTLTPIEGTDNLFGFEMNAAKILEDWKKKHREDIDETFNSFGKGVDVKFDREVMEELFTVSPPGIDELLALNEIINFVNEGRFDVYILDSAATGHLIRFLEMPRVIRDWLKTIFKLLMKYKGVVRLNKIAEEMIDFSKKVRKVQQILTDSDNAEFVAVTIPETMGFAETEDLLAALARLKIPCRHLMINMVIPSNHCNFCSVKREEQLKVVREIAKKLGKYQINQIPLFPYQIKGINRLGELADKIYG